MLMSLRLRELAGLSLSSKTGKGTAFKPCPFFEIEILGSKSWNRIPTYPADAGAGSSTFASRRNFAASSGGVGLM